MSGKKIDWQMAWRLRERGLRLPPYADRYTDPVLARTALLHNLAAEDMDRCDYQIHDMARRTKTGCEATPELPEKENFQLPQEE